MSDALEIANRLEGVRVREHYDLIPKRIAVDELRRQHAEIESLRAQLEVGQAEERTLREALAAAENAKTDPDEPEAAWALIEQRHLATLAQAAKLSAAPSQPVAQPTEQEAQLVLERDSARRAYDRQCRVTNTAYAKIRELEQAAQQARVAQGEPVYQTQSHDGRWIDLGRSSYDYNVRNGHTGRVLYTYPQQLTEPVTDEQIKEEWFHIHSLSISTLEKVILLARAIERLHGIKE
jgi:hypothetical protein